MLKGEKIYLAAVERNDLHDLMLWRNREDFRKYFREYREINEDMQIKWYEDYVLKDKNTIIVMVFQGKLKNPFPFEKWINIIY